MTTENLNFKYINLADYDDDINDSLVNDIYFYIDDKIPRIGENVLKYVHPYCSLLEVINNTFFKNDINAIINSYIIFIDAEDIIKTVLQDGYMEHYSHEYEISTNKIDIEHFSSDDTAYILLKIESLGSKDFVHLPVQYIISSVRDYKVQGETISPYNDTLMLVVNIPFNRAFCREALTFDIESFLIEVNEAAQSLETPNNPQYRNYVLHTVNKWTESGFWKFKYGLSSWMWKMIIGTIFGTFLIYLGVAYGGSFVTWFSATASYYLPGLSLNKEVPLLTPDELEGLALYEARMEKTGQKFSDAPIHVRDTNIKGEYFKIDDQGKIRYFSNI